MEILLISIQVLLVFFGIRHFTKGSIYNALLFTGLTYVLLGVLTLMMLFLKMPASLPLGLIILVSLAIRKHYNFKVKEFLFLMGVFIVAFSTWIIQGALMYTKKRLPDLLFNVDTAFTLNILSGISRTGEIPFQSIENLDNFSKYHYGSHALLVGFTELFGGVSLNHLITWICLFGFFIVVVTYLVVKSFGTITRPWQPIVLLFVLTCAGQPMYNIFDWSTLKNMFLYNGGYPLFQNLIGAFIAIATFLFIIQSLKNSNQIFISSFLVIVLPLFKVPYLPLIAIGFGLSCSFLFISLKSRKYLIALVVAMLGSVATLYLSMPMGSTITQYGLGPSALLSRHDWFGMIIWLLPVPFLVFKQRKISKTQLVGLFFALPIPLILTLVTIDDENAWQLFSLSPIFSLMALISFWPQQLTKLSTGFNIAAYFVVSVLLLKHVSNEITYSYSIIVHPESGHEYADLRNMNSVLEKIPRKETLLLATDMHYPADNFKRNYRPFHLALAGHQCYNADLIYMTSDEYRSEAIELISLVNEEDRNEIAIRRGITHIINNDDPFDISVFYLIPEKNKSSFYGN